MDTIKLWTLVLATMCSGACAPHVVLAADYEAPAWLGPVVDQAVGIWQGYGYMVERADASGTTPVTVSAEDLEDGALGIYMWDGAIRLAPALDKDPDTVAFIGGGKPWDGDRARVCILAHEIGHALGLGHVTDDHRLMYDGFRLPAAGLCYPLGGGL